MLDSYIEEDKQWLSDAYKHATGLRKRPGIECALGVTTGFFLWIIWERRSSKRSQSMDGHSKIESSLKHCEEENVRCEWS